MREVTEMSLREVLRRMMGYNIVCVLVLLVTSAAFPGSQSIYLFGRSLQSSYICANIRHVMYAGSYAFFPAKLHGD